MADLVLSHTTALEVMRRPYFPKHLATAEFCPTELPDAMPDASDLECAVASVSQLAGVEAPFHVLVGDPACRHRFSLVRPHVFQGTLPPGSLLRLAPGVRCASPALLVVQMAPFLTDHELLMLLCELLGSYAVDPGGETGVVGRFRPLLTPGALMAFLDALGPARGTAIVRAALPSAPVGAASPMEGKLYIRATSRFASGGYRLGEIALNDPVELERISAGVRELRVRKPDLLLLAPAGEPGAVMPFRGVAFDYHGAWHSRDPLQVKRDTDRANELLADGFKDYVFWKSNYDDLDCMDDLMAKVRRDLGLPPRKLSTERAARERAARAALWAELERIDGVHWSGFTAERA
ncbi:hypothetical protein [Olsenella sp. An290]|uniref:hypothetical protein n=1 Tax=Olsenella sp. An290 TaxID=1965625 RepID=UPI00117C0949|nr:hypothetical protein [Olsenella sp. An290]